MTYLSHHGIKGQQWGVKHGPPYPISDSNGEVTISKGTKIYRVSRYIEAQSKGHAYVTYLKEDRERYRGFFAAKLKVTDLKSPVYAVEMEAKTELRSPSKKTRLETFKEMYRDDPEIRKRLGDYHKEQEWNTVTPLPKKYYEWRYSNLKEDKIPTKGYDVFKKSLGGDEYIRSEYFNRLSAKGYNFVRDDQDAGYLGTAPSIIFDREAVLKYNGQRELSNKEIMKNQAKYKILVDGKTRRKITELPKG